jgi:hypothetical protein
MLLLTIAFYAALIGAFVASWLTRFSFIYCIPFFVLYIIGLLLYLRYRIIFCKDSFLNSAFVAILWPWVILWYNG